MQNQLSRAVTALFLGSLAFSFFAAPHVFAQGSLAPPGAPAPTMLTLSQMQPCTPITNTRALTISLPGSYYLTTNISVTSGSAITIATNNIVLDLKGFSLQSTQATPTGSGILLNNGVRNIHIFNGSIIGYVNISFTGSGFGTGINCSTVLPTNVVVSGVSVSGCLYQGIYLGLGTSTVVDSWTVTTVGGDGIIADSVANSAAYYCGGDGIDATTVFNSSGNATINGTGISASQSAQNCLGTGYINGTGLSAANAENCYGEGGVAGINANRALNCFGKNDLADGDGLDAENAENCYGFSEGGDGLNAGNSALNCYGTTYLGTGLSCSYIAQNCYGYTTIGPNGLYAYDAETCYGVNETNNTGLQALYTAQNCQGYSVSGIGLNTPGNALNCYGSSGGASFGLYAGHIAICCFGSSSNSTGLVAGIANSCAGSGTPTYSAGNAYNMPAP